MRRAYFGIRKSPSRKAIYARFLYRGSGKFFARPRRKQARKHVRDARDFKTSRRELPSSFFFWQGKAPKKIHAILTQKLACFLPGRAKDLSAPLYNQTTHWNSEGLPHNHKFHRSENFRPTLKIRFLWERVHCRLANSSQSQRSLLSPPSVHSNKCVFLGSPQGLDGNLLQNAGIAQPKGCHIPEG